MITKYNTFRIDKQKTPNDGNRTLFESVVHADVIKALETWLENDINKCVLIGGVALSYYVIPRMTQVIDMLFLSKDDIPQQLDGFKRTRNGAFQHKITHVEVEVVTPEYINLRRDLAEKIVETSIRRDGIFIASPEGLIVSKLGRFKLQDMTDIENLILSQKEIDLSGFNLTEEELDKFNYIKNKKYRI